MEDKIRAVIFQHYYTSKDLTAVSMFNYYATLYKANKERLIPTLEVPREFYKERKTKFVNIILNDDEIKRMLKKAFGTAIPYFRAAMAREVKEWEWYFPTEEELYFMYEYRKEPIDVILNGRYNITAILRIAMEERKSSYYSNVRVPIIHFQHETWRDEKSMQIMGRKEVKTMLVINGLLADSVWLFNEPDREEFLKEAKTILSPAEYKDLKKKAEIVRPLYDYELFDSLYEEAEIKRTKRIKEENTIKIWHGGSLERKRQLYLVAEVLNELAEKKGKRIDFVLNISSRHWKQEIKERYNYSFIKPIYEMPREEYIKQMISADIIPCTYLYFGTALTCIEATAVGLLPIYWDKEEVKDRVPNNYPYIVSSKEELEEVLDELTDPESYIDAKEKYGEKLIEKTRKMFGEEEARRTFERIKATYYDYIDRKDEKDILLWDAVRDAFKSVESEIEDERLVKLISYMTKREKPEKAVRALITNIGLRILARKNGFIDVGDINRVVWKRVG